MTLLPNQDINNLPSVLTVEETGRCNVYADGSLIPSVGAIDLSDGSLQVMATPVNGNAAMIMNLSTESIVIESLDGKERHQLKPEVKLNIEDFHKSYI